MATMLPELSDAQLAEVQSKAEVKVYRALREFLSAEFVVFFQVGWILQRENEEARDGETDFLVCHPKFGFLTIEVKGGGVGFDASIGEWYSVDRQKQRHSINNPISQAMKAKYSILTKLTENRRWRESNISHVLRGHSVFFPDLSNTNGLDRPDMPAELIGCSNDLLAIRAWVDRVFTYWANAGVSWSPIGHRGIDVLREVFARSFVAMPLLATELIEQEARRLVLTKDQLKVLDVLRKRRRVTVSGGAGTGKTVLAVEKARRLANEGFKTLLTCYNRQLADHLATICSGVQGLSVMSFHQLCHRTVELASQQSGRDLVAEARFTYPGKGHFDVHLPNALTYAAEILETRYDAIVCDEGQDFLEEFWLPLELLLSDYEKSPFYIFFDDNQNLYARVGTFPIPNEPFALTSNCRNTAQIHRAAYKHYKGEPVEAPDIDGDEVEFEAVNVREQQAVRVHAHVVDLIARQGIAPDDIVVLIVDSGHKDGYYSALQSRPLPKSARWLIESTRGQGTVLLDTVQRFKGLESAIVILWGMDTVDLVANMELVYVGMTRGKSVLNIVATREVCAALA